MKILTSKHIKEGDLLTIKREPITSIDLMERASVVLYKYILEHKLIKGNRVTVFSGVGNNGGDGLVVARLLTEKGYDVTVYIIQFKPSSSEDFSTNLKRLKQTNCTIKSVQKGDDLPYILESTTVIDAIFGVGLNRPLEEWVQCIITHINLRSNQTLSIDLPSGLFTEKVSDLSNVIKADYTLTFQVPKFVFFLKDTACVIGQWILLDIGIDKQFLSEVETDRYLVTKPLIKDLYRQRLKFSHKGTYGHGLIIGGEYGKIGAVQLSAKACLHSGAGLVRVFTPECGYIPLQTALPEVMVITDVCTKKITNIPTNIQASAVGIGIGMGTDSETALAFKAFLKQHTSPLVIDADAINILAKYPDFLEYLPKESILTPHPKELSRLIGPWTDDFDRLYKAKQFADQYHLILVVKGAYTQTIFKNNVYINSTGNQGMATAGSGDVLTGVITGLLAQNYKPLEAAILGVYLHGLSGDKAFLSDKNYHTITASSLIHFLPHAFDEVCNN